MLRLTIIFCFIAFLASMLGHGSFAIIASGIAKLLLFTAVVFYLMSLFAGKRSLE